tara:strand:- start:487 stop:2157 length:1671 start_codon:yes stop_codon:yes gene_type:complete
MAEIRRLRAEDPIGRPLPPTTTPDDWVGGDPRSGIRRPEPPIGEAPSTGDYGDGIFSALRDALGLDDYEAISQEYGKAAADEAFGFHRKMSPSISRQELDAYSNALDLPQSLSPIGLRMPYELSSGALYGRNAVRPGISRAGGGIVGLQQGGPAPSQTRVTHYGVPQQTATQWAGLTDRMVREGQRAYTPYHGQRFAGFTQPEAASMAAKVGYAQSGGPAGTQQAAQTYADTAGQYANVAGTAGAPAMSKGANLEDYKSQYTQGVIDPQTRQIRQQGQIQMSDLGSRAGAAGAFGGYRHGLQEGNIAQNVAQQTADVTAKGQEQAFQDAVQRFESDRAAQQAGTGQQLSALGGLANVAHGQAQLGGQQQQQEFARLGQMEGAGEKQRAMQDRSLEVGYQDWQNQQDQERRNIEWQGQAMQGLPYQGSQTTSLYAPSQGSPTGDMLATGIAGAGLWDAYRQGQGQQQTPDYSSWVPQGTGNQFGGQDLYNTGQNNTGGSAMDPSNFFQGGNANIPFTGGGPPQQGATGTSPDASSAAAGASQNNYGPEAGSEDWMHH